MSWPGDMDWFSRLLLESNFFFFLMLVYVVQRHLVCYEPWNGNKKGTQEEKRLMSDNQEVNERTFKTHSSNEGNIT